MPPFSLVIGGAPGTNRRSFNIPLPNTQGQATFVATAIISGQEITSPPKTVSVTGSAGSTSTGASGNGMNFPPTHVTLMGTDLVVTIGDEDGDNTTFTRSLLNGPTNYESNYDLGYGLHLNIVGSYDIFNGENGMSPRFAVMRQFNGGGSVTGYYQSSGDSPNGVGVGIDIVTPSYQVNQIMIDAEGHYQPNGSGSVAINFHYN